MTAYAEPTGSVIPRVKALSVAALQTLLGISNESEEICEKMNLYSMNPTDVRKLKKVCFAPPSIAGRLGASSTLEILRQHAHNKDCRVFSPRGNITHLTPDSS